MSGTIYTEQSVLGHTLGFAAMPFPGTVYVGLCAMAPPPTETTGGAEASGGGYSRVAASFALVDGPANIAANVASVEYPAATGGWGTLGYFELWDSPSGGNRLYWGTILDPASGMPAAITVYATDIVRFSAGTLAVQAATGTPGATSAGAYLPLAGGQLTGPLLLAADPTAPLGASTKQYVDGRLSSGANIAGVVNVLNHGVYGDGIHDDTAAIQLVLNTSAGSSTVFVPNTGHSFMVKQLTIPSNTDLVIDGTLMLQPNSSGPVISMTSVANISIRGYGVIDGNIAAQTSAGGALAGIAPNGVTNLTIRDITIQNAFLWNLNAVASSRVLVQNVKLLGGFNASQFAAGCNDCWLMNCTINGPSNDIGFAFYGGCTNCGAIGNTVTNAGNAGHVTAVGICVLSDGGQVAGSSNIAIADNIIHNCSGSGIQVFTDQSSYHTGVIISNNRCSGNGTSGIGSRGDFDIHTVNSATVTGNQSDKFGSSAQPWWGVYVNSDASGVVLTGNLVSSTGQGGSAGVGLYVNSPPALLASGNFFIDDQPTPTMMASIGGTAGSQNVFTGNHCERPSVITVQADTVVAQAANGQWQIGADNSTHDVSLAIHSGANTNRFIEYGTNESPRWYVGAVGPAEIGSNVGSDFNVIACNDAGASLSTPLTINRATGKMTLALPPTITTIGNFANDAAAAIGGTPIGGLYRNGSVVQVRVS